MSVEMEVVVATVIALLIIWTTAVWVKDKFYRKRGLWIESASIKSLRLPKGWSISPNVPVPGLGNCDVLITCPAETRYAVEIKSSESAKKVFFSLFTKDEIRKSNGKRFPRDHVAQTLAVATKLNAVPVLWFPKARCSKKFKTRSGVTVVLGGNKVLERAIGARWGWFWL